MTGDTGGTAKTNIDSDAMSTAAPAAQPFAETTRRARLTMDGRRLKELVKAGYFWLRQQEEVVNGYNVYPVPDGDTGTNMMHTMRSAWEAIAGLDEANVGVVAKAISNGALRGSRGNSGIILSQLWRGFARSLDHKEICDATDLVAALKEGAKTAYAGVGTPVEGTILTVARETADAVEIAAHHTHDMRKLLEIAKSASYDSVQRTPNLLKILKDAGVIDSGGYGFYIILEGMWRFLNGMSVDEMSRSAATKVMSAGADLAQEGGWGYDVQFLIYPRGTDRLDVNKIRSDVEAMGECPLVFGDDAMVKVHVHVPDPGVAISYGAALGSLRDVVVEDMQAQSEAFVPHGDTPAQMDERLPEVDLAMIAVASGDGMVRAFKDIGVRIVIEGGQTMNPSVDDFLNAIKRANAKSVILLPNNGNIVMTAKQAAELSEVPAKVVTTKTLPQGIAAAISFNFSGSAEENAEFMHDAMQRVTTGEITIATRNVTLNGVTVSDGQTIGLINDELAVAGEDVETTLMALLQKAGAAAHELITLYFGNGMSEADAGAIAGRVRETYAGQQVDTIPGNQPHYYFVVGIE
jgi:DAK2 domain fusion protein YloV